GVVHRFVEEAIQVLGGIHHVALPIGVNARGVAYVKDRVALRTEVDTLEVAGQKTAVPLAGGDRLLLAGPARGSKDDKAGQVVAVSAEAVPGPRAHARPAGDERAGVHERVRRIVVDRFGVDRAHDAQLVGDAGQLWKDGGDFLARLAALLER